MNAPHLGAFFFAIALLESRGLRPSALSKPAQTR
jgi:hypothetical protein